MSLSLSFGEVLFDCFEDRRQIGGALLYVAWNLRKFGFPAAVVCVRAGVLGRAGIDSSWITEREEPTGTVDIALSYNLTIRRLAETWSEMRTSGWLKELPGEDGREHLHQVTAKGRRLLNEAIPAQSEAQEKARKLLSNSGVEALWEFASKQGGP